MFSRLSTHKPAFGAGERGPLTGGLPSFTQSAAFDDRRVERDDGHFGPSSLMKLVGREGIEPPQPKAADLQPTSHRMPFALEFPRKIAREMFSTRPSQLPILFKHGGLTQLGQSR